MTEFSKRCASWQLSSSCFLLLFSQVALGKSKTVVSGYIDKPEKGFDSVFAVGRNRPIDQHNVRLPTGT